MVTFYRYVNVYRSFTDSYVSLPEGTYVEMISNVDIHLEAGFRVDTALDTCGLMIKAGKNLRLGRSGRIILSYL